MTTQRKDQIHALLKGIETGDEAAVAVISPVQYIQHNPETHEGREGLAALFKRLSQSAPRVNLARTFSDGDYVFAHTEYDFSRRRIGFEVFRFEGDLTVEHWDNIQSRQDANASGHSMIDGATEVTDRDKTEANRALIQSFINDVLITAQAEQLDTLLARYINTKQYTEHSPDFSDDIQALRLALTASDSNSGIRLNYQHLHRLLAEGNFVLSVCEGHRNGIHTSFYDLYRIENSQIVEHWDTTEAVPALDTWKNDNGKF